MQVSSTGNLLTVRFKSDAYVSGRGFNASWAEVQGGEKARHTQNVTFKLLLHSYWSFYSVLLFLSVLWKCQLIHQWRIFFQASWMAANLDSKSIHDAIRNVLNTLANKNHNFRNQVNQVTLQKRVCTENYQWEMELCITIPSLGIRIETVSQSCDSFWRHQVKQVICWVFLGLQDVMNSTQQKVE